MASTKKVLITGSGGLIGSDCARTLAAEGWNVVGVDNDMRQQFFGAAGTTRPVVRNLVETVPGYRHFDLDIRDRQAVRDLVGDIFQAVSGEAIFRKSSFLVGQLGERVASKRLTLIDDGTIARGLGSRPFDAEGLPTRRTTVISEGVLESYLLNTYTGRKLGLRSTGNAGRGLVGAPSVDAGNLYIAPGPHSPDEIIGSVSQGLFITELIGFGVNIVTGDYSRSASGIWIENGQLTFPVQGVTIAGNLKEMLNSVEMVGNDLDFRGSVVSPTLLIGSMTIGA